LQCHWSSTIFTFPPPFASKETKGSLQYWKVTFSKGMLSYCLHELQEAGNIIQVCICFLDFISSIICNRKWMQSKSEGLGGSSSPSVSPLSDHNSNCRGYGGRSYGVSRRGVRGNFIPPIKSNGSNNGNLTQSIGGKRDDAMDDSTKKWYKLMIHLFIIKQFLTTSTCFIVLLYDYRLHL